MQTYFAKIDAQGIVQDVIVAEQAFIDTLPDASAYVQTFFDADGSPEKMFNFATVGGRFDAENNAFIGQAPYPSWTLNEAFAYVAPTPMPLNDPDKYYGWDEGTTSWVEMPLPKEVDEGYVPEVPPEN